jgi:hypothetical protein
MDLNSNISISVVVLAPLIMEVTGFIYRNLENRQLL